MSSRSASPLPFRASRALASTSCQPVTPNESDDAPARTSPRSSVHFAGSHTPSGPSSASSNSQGVTIGLKKSCGNTITRISLTKPTAKPLNPPRLLPHIQPAQSTRPPQSSPTSPGSAVPRSSYSFSSLHVSKLIVKCRGGVWRMRDRCWTPRGRRCRLTWLGGGRTSGGRGVWRWR